MSLVVDLRHLAIDGKTDVSELLRKAYTLAHKLKLPSFKKWVNNELEGYLEKKVPPYRIIRGRPVYDLEGRGWFPMFCGGDEELLELLSTLVIRRSVMGLQQELASNSMSIFHLNYPASVEENLRDNFSLGASQPALEVSRSTYVAILDSVRTRILKTCLKLEAGGVLGDIATITPVVDQDKSANVYNITNIGSMENSAIQQSSPGAEIAPRNVHEIETGGHRERVTWTVSNSTQNPACKLLAVELYNAGLHPLHVKSVECHLDVPGGSNFFRMETKQQAAHLLAPKATVIYRFGKYKCDTDLLEQIALLPPEKVYIVVKSYEGVEWHIGGEDIVTALAPPA